jgi:hypothetical protein
MRRIAALTITTVLMGGGMAALATSAEAAAGHKWTAPNQVGGTKSSGTYSRSGGRTYVKGKLSDTSRNGRTACVRFKFTEGRSSYLYRSSIKYTTGPWFDGHGTISISTSSAYSSHLYVQECVLNTKTHKAKYPKKWKKLF